jgi:hypothetical protein
MGEFRESVPALSAELKRNPTARLPPFTQTGAFKNWISRRASGLLAEIRLLSRGLRPQNAPYRIRGKT